MRSSVPCPPSRRGGVWNVRSSPSLLLRFLLTSLLLTLAEGTLHRNPLNLESTIDRSNASLLELNVVENTVLAQSLASIGFDMTKDFNLGCVSEEYRAKLIDQITKGNKIQLTEHVGYPGISLVHASTNDRDGTPHRGNVIGDGRSCFSWETPVKNGREGCEIFGDKVERVEKVFASIKNFLRLTHDEAVQAIDGVEDEDDFGFDFDLVAVDDEPDELQEIMPDDYRTIPKKEKESAKYSEKELQNLQESRLNKIASWSLQFLSAAMNNPVQQQRTLGAAQMMFAGMFMERPFINTGDIKGKLELGLNLKMTRVSQSTVFTEHKLRYNDGFKETEIAQLMPEDVKALKCLPGMYGAVGYNMQGILFNDRTGLTLPHAKHAVTAKSVNIDKSCARLAALQLIRGWHRQDRDAPYSLDPDSIIGHRHISKSHQNESTPHVQGSKLNVNSECFLKSRKEKGGRTKIVNCWAFAECHFRLAELMCKTEHPE
eukprot:jgi/Bigna1/69976/fgenesh1_pg.10_\